MHDVKKEAKASAKAKLSKMGGKSREFNDHSTYDGVPPINTNEQAGLPIINKKPSLSQDTADRIMRKAGGRVGEKRLDKKPRAKKDDGGSIGSRIKAGLNKMVGYESEAEKQARQMRDVGKEGTVDYRKMKADTDRIDRMTGYKKGGKVKKHEDEAEDKALIRKMVKKEDLKGMSKGGRSCYARGGAAKGKTTVNIVIGGKDGAGAPPLGLGALPPMPPPMPPAPPMGGPGGPPPGMPPMPPGGPLMRKAGGRANADVPVKKPGRTPEGYPKMDYGAATGQGRRQKILAQE